MRLQTELDAILLPAVFQDFEAIVNARSWGRMVELVSGDMRGRPHLATHLRRQHRIAYALSYLQDEFLHGRQVAPSAAPDLYEAATLIVQFTEICKAYPNISHALTRRLHSALDYPEHMRGLLFELEIATQLSKRGMAISFPDLDGTGRFDFLAEDSDGQLVELECKYITHEKGRSVSRYSAMLIYGSLAPVIDQFAHAAAHCVIVRIIFNGKAPRGDAEVRALAKPVADVLAGSERCDYEFGRVQILQFDPITLSDKPTRSEIDELLIANGISNVESATRKYPSGVVVITTVESVKRSKVLESVFATAKDAAKEQLTGTRPSMLCIKYEDLPPEQLIDIAKELDGNPSALRVRASVFLNSLSASRVSVLTFFADAVDLTSRGSVTTRENATYSFRNRRNMFNANSVFRGMFGS